MSSKTASPARLHRSFSDSAALEAEVEELQEETAPATHVETGPWTTIEAFLLFDWWPPGREKPDYGVLPPPQAVKRSGGEEQKRRNHAPGFQSARTVRRDGVDMF